jgi:hypothetical protein
MSESATYSDELEAMPEYHRLSVVRQFATSVALFDANARELSDTLSNAEDPSKAIELWSIDNRPKLNHFQLQLMRLLHNFVASAFTLVDHARRFYTQNYSSDARFSDYEGCVRHYFGEDPLSQFVQGLRNYVLHKELPDLATELSYEQGGTFRHRHYWHLAELKTFDRWNASAKRFLAKAPDDIDIAQVTEAYYAKVRSFYEWVFERLREIHKNDLEAVEAKRRAWLPAYTAEWPRLLEMGLMQFQQNRIRPEPFFLSYLERERWQELCDKHGDPEERGAALLREMALLAPGVLQFEAAVRQAFRRYYESLPERNPGPLVGSR